MALYKAPFQIMLVVGSDSFFLKNMISKWLTSFFGKLIWVSMETEVTAEVSKLL